MGVYFFRGPESENHIFSVWSAHVCVCVCVIIGVTQKQILSESLNLASHICIIPRCYLKRFITTGQKLCVLGYTKYSYTLWSLDGIYCGSI